MNLLTPSHPSQEANSGQPAHSPAEFANSLLKETRSLGLVSQSAQVLKDFSGRVVESVQALEKDVVVDAYSGREFLALISRLNQEIAPFLQQQAQPPAKLGPIHIWVIDQADHLSAEQQSIIFRLIELFPTLPFRVIWLSQKALPAWESRAGPERIFVDLDAETRTETASSFGLTDPLDWVSPERLNPADTPLDDAWPGNASSKVWKSAAALLIAGLLGTWGWMSASRPQTPASTQASTNEAPTTAPAPALPSTTAPTTPEPAAATPAALPTVAAEQVATAPKAVETPAKTPPPVSTSSATKPLPEVARTGARWLKALPADTLVVEHGTFSSLEQAQKLQAKHKELVTARIIAIRKAPNADEWQYSVVTGPFRSEDRAKTYVSRLDWRASTRIRSTDKLKPLLASTP